MFFYKRERERHQINRRPDIGNRRDLLGSGQKEKDFRRNLAESPQIILIQRETPSKSTWASESPHPTRSAPTLEFDVTSFRKHDH